LTKTQKQQTNGWVGIFQGGADAYAGVRSFINFRGGLGCRQGDRFQLFPFWSVISR